MSDRAVRLNSSSALRVAYRALSHEPLGHDVLAAVTFNDAEVSADPRFVHVELEPLNSAPMMEVWTSCGPVRHGTDGLIRFAADADLCFGILELDEREFGGISGAAEAAYLALRRFLAGSAHSHLLRVWNYFDAINRGSGDEERYKLFCLGRAAGLGAWPAEAYPAATVIGRRDGSPQLQVYWLCGCVSGVALDNPRQTRPSRYPREYGPRAPQFSRAMLAGSDVVLVSGTASIRGHASHHHGDLSAQTREVLENLASVIGKAAALAPALPTRLAAGTVLKVYLRDGGCAPEVEAVLRSVLPAQMRYVLLAGDVCRADLLLEAEAVHSS